MRVFNRCNSLSQLFKVEGAGNDFILATGNWAKRFENEPEMAERLCQRHSGIGADGTLSLFPGTQNHVRLVYRNSDGSLASFCANGTRCAAKAAVEILGLDSILVVNTGWGDIPAQVRENSVTLDLPAPKGECRQLAIEAGGQRWQASLLEIGVPHLIIRCTNLSELDLTLVAPPLRNHKTPGDHGANVDFVDFDQAGTLLIRSWERGVEGETLCCGSGVVAAALVEMENAATNRIEVKPISGATLVVEALGPAPLCRSSLTGPANIIAELTMWDM